MTGRTIRLFTAAWMVLGGGVAASFVASGDRVRSWLTLSDGWLDVLVAASCLGAATIGAAALRRFERPARVWALIPVLALLGAADAAGWGTRWWWRAPVVSGVRIDGPGAALRALGSWARNGVPDDRIVTGAALAMAAGAAAAVVALARGRLGGGTPRHPPSRELSIAVALVLAGVAADAAAPATPLWSLAVHLIRFAAAGLLTTAGLRLALTPESLVGWRRRLEPWGPGAAGGHAEAG